METADLDYPLPDGAIAQQPIEPRDAARLLVAGEGRTPEHRTVADLPDLVAPGSVVVVNDTRVIPARLALRKPTGGAVEVLLLDRRPTGDWEALVKPSRRVADGTVLTPAEGGGLQVTVGEVLGDDGRRRVTVDGDIEAVGEVPLPPYIHEALDDPERYQQVLHMTNRKHDVIAIDLHDPLERDIANVGLLTLEDAETGELIWVDTADREWRTLFHNQVDQFETRKNKAFANAAVDQVSIHTDQDYFKALTLFFEKRAKRIRY